MSFLRQNPKVIRENFKFSLRFLIKISEKTPKIAKMFLRASPPDPYDIPSKLAKTKGYFQDAADTGIRQRIQYP